MSRRAPLEGVRVLDLTAYWAGPIAGRIFADLGADVIKVESIQRIDGWRGALGRAMDGRPYEAAASHNGVNGSKRGITLDLRSSRGVSLCKQLIAISDVLLENFSPRVMGQFGLDYPAVREVNPSIVMASISGFGASGPLRDHVSYALTVESESGIVGLTGYAGGPPLMQSASVADPLGGMNGLTAALMALYRRKRTGEGCWIDVSQVQGVTALLGDQLLDYAINGRVASRRGNADWNMAPHGVYPCAGDDAWIAIAVATNEQWQALCRVIGRADLARSPELATSAGRLAASETLDRLVADWTCTHDKHAAMATLQAAGVPAGAVQTTLDTPNDPQLQARDFWQEVDRAYVGRHPQAAAGIVLDGEQLRIRRPAPTLGEHNEEVLGELLGVTPDEIAELAALRVIGTEALYDSPT